MDVATGGIVRVAMTRARPRSSFGSIAARTPLTFAGQRIGVMGGTFNPPHDGHVQVAATAIKRLGLDQVWWLVTPGNPLKPNNQLPPLASRIMDARQLARHPRMRITGFEAALGSAFTVDTVTFLRRRYPGVHFIWLMGADGLASFHRWRDWRRIATLLPMVVVDRPGYRLKAMASPAAHALAGSFVPETAAGRLTRARRGRLWTFLTTRLSPLSSTDIRAKSARKP
jgi:nicotinate-nucleotide adenylyltransferase